MNQSKSQNLLDDWETKIDDWERKRDWAKYRWEFMRRNSEYGKDFAEVEKVRKNVVLPPHLKKIRDEWGFMIYPDGYEKEEKKERQLCNKHGLQTGTMLDPNKSFEDIVGPKPPDVFPKGNRNITEQQFVGLFVASLINPPTALNLFFSQNDPEKVTIEIDFKLVNSIAMLNKRIEKEIQNHYDHELVNKSQTYMTVVGYDVYLRVGDLKRNDEKLTNREIAEIVEPNRYEQNESSAVRAISDYYERYLYFVNGGYKSMTFE